ncbi:hypothetical protein EV127DRAFT_447588 [Xylaria flabelliformis]|nr:hypothetical protein EV127DRAFT_447588 [Xylaria flabelliformis]
MPPMNAPPMRAQPNRDMRWKSQGVPQLTNIHIPPAMAPPIRAPDERIARVESPVIPKYLTKPIPQHTPVIKMHRERDRSTESLVTHQLPSKPMRPMNAPRIRTPPEQIARVDSPVIPQYLAKPMPPIPQHTPATKMTRGRDRSAGSLVTHQRPIRTSPQQRARKESPIVHQRPPIAQEIIVHKQDRPPPEPETARISYLPSRTKSLKKRDSNCVSLLSDDGIEFEFLERRSVSPIRNE